MRKILTFLCAALMSVSMWADPATCGPNLTWNLTGDVLTISGTGDMYDYDDEGNFAPWFSSRESITSVIISNGVTSIGQMAFLFCTGLTSVTIPNSVTSIGMGAFAGCGMTSITIPNSVKSIGQRAFLMCSSLETVTINAESLESYGTNAFQGTAEGLKIYVPAGSVDTYKAAENWSAYADKIEAIVVEGVEIGGLYYNLKNNNKTAEVTYKSYANYKYNEGWDITTANIPASVEYNSVTYSVTSIGYSAFTDCSGLTSVTIPNGVTSIGLRAFMNCSNLESVTIPSSVTSIGAAAFGACIGLTSIEIPNGVEYIADQAFGYCMGLTSIEIPNSVEYIEEQAFAMCTGLTSIEIPNSVDSIGAGAFYLCTGLTSVTIPNSVEYIEDYAFAGCTGLTSVTIGNSVKYIGAEAFNGCTAVTDVYCYPNAADLTWEEEGCNDFKADGSTVCHVHADQLETYQSKFTGTVNVTFEDDLPASDPHAVENVQTNEVQATKFFRDGQILILRDGKTYTLTGQAVK